MDHVLQAVAVLQAETSTYPSHIQVWMKVMGLSFLGSILFIYWRVGARWIFAILIINLVGLVIGKIGFPDASRTVIGTYVHLIFWPPLLWGVFRSAKDLSFSRSHNSATDWVYTIWLTWASSLVLISLLFDFRTMISM